MAEMKEGLYFVRGRGGKIHLEKHAAGQTLPQFRPQLRWAVFGSEEVRRSPADEIVAGPFTVEQLLAGVKPKGRAVQENGKEEGKAG